MSCSKTAPHRTAPAQFTWTGGGSDYQWDNPANWDQGTAVPGAVDDVSIGSVASPIVIDGVAEARSIMSSAALDIQSTGNFALETGGSIFGNLRVWGSLSLADGFAVSLSASSLDLTGQLQLGAGSQLSPMGNSALHDGAVITGDGLLVLNSSTLALDGAITVSNLDALGATLVGPGSLTITDTINLQGATLARDYLNMPGTLNIDLGATLNLTGYTATTIHGWTINAEGTINWTQGDVNNYGSTVNIAEGASFNITTSMGTWRDSALDGLSSINNAGTLTKSGGMGMAVTVEAALNSTANIQVFSGCLLLEQGGSFSGLIDIMQGAASVALTNGVFLAQGFAQAFGQGQGPLIVDGSTSATLRFVINIAQELGIPSVSLRNLELRRGGEISGPGNLQITQRLYCTGGAMSGPGNLEIAQGSIMVLDGRPITVERDVVNRGITTVSTGARVAFDSNLTNLGTFEMLADSVFSADGQLGSFRNNPNLVAANVSIVRNGIPGVPDAGPAVFGVPLLNWDVVSVNMGILTIDNVTTTNNPGSTCRVAAGAQLNFSAAGFGTLTATFLAGSGTVGSGRVNLVDNAHLVVGAGEFLEIENFTMNGEAQLFGTGTLSCNIFDWKGGTLKPGASVKVDVASTMTIGDNCAIENATILNMGTINFIGVPNPPNTNASLEMSEGAIIRNDGTGGAGIFNVLSASNTNDTTPLGAVSNPTIALVDGGEFNMGTGSGSNTIQVVLVNKSSEVNLNGRTLRLSRALVSSDPAQYAPVDGRTDFGGNQAQLIITNGYYVQTGGSTDLAGGAIQASNATVVSGSLDLGGGNIDLSSSSGGAPGSLLIEPSAFLTGSGNIVANVTNLGSVAISNGTMLANPALNVFGTYGQAANGVLLITLGGAANYDQLNVYGDVFLGGTMNILLDNYNPGNGIFFDVLTFTGTRQGQFTQVQGPGNNWTLDYDTGHRVKVRS